MKLLIAPCIVACFVASPALSADYKSCSSIKVAKDRLACFDLQESKKIPQGKKAIDADLAKKDVERFKSALTSRFKDPSSAIFKDLAAYGENDPVSVTFLCGYVNGKNSYGGYVGFKKFVMTGTDTVQMDDPENPFAIDEKWKSSCTGIELYRQP